jgi:hypothetical protein
MIEDSYIYPRNDPGEFYLPSGKMRTLALISSTTLNDHRLKPVGYKLRQKSQFRLKPVLVG